MPQVDIKDFLPHRPPMLMVDDLVSIDDTSVSCLFRVKEDCLFVQNGLLAGPGLIEHAAQTSTAIVGQRFFLKGQEGPRVLGFISAIKNVMIGNLPSVDQVLHTRSELISHVPNGAVSICVTQCTTTVNDETVLDCSMNFLIQQQEA